MQRLQRWARGVLDSYVRRDGPIYALALGLAGGFGLVVKQVSLTLSTTGGYLVVSRVLGLAGPDELPPTARLGLFEYDILWGLVAVPALGSAVLCALPRSLARPAAFVLTATLCGALFVALLFLGSVGRLPSAAMLSDALEFGARHPEYIPQYVSPRSLLKLFGLLGAIAALVWLRNLVPLFGGSPVSARRGAKFVGGGIVAAALIAVAIGWLDATPRMVSHRSILSQSLAALRQRPARLENVDTRNADELAGFFRAFTRTPAAGRGPYFGAQRNSDVIFIVLETAPMASVAIDGGIESLPAIGALAHQSLYARRHVSTFPYTSDAMFSIFSGMYPVLLRRTAVGQPAGARMPSALPRVLAGHGYHTYRYAYEDSFESDTQMFRVLGMEQFFHGDTDPRSASPAIQAQVDATMREYGPLTGAPARTLRHYLEIDFACLSAMLEQVERSKRRGERFMAAFFPIVGHGPWPALRGEQDVRTRGRRLVELQDRWIGQLSALLEKNGWAEDTLIVLTGDHGIRTRDEDPDFPVGTMSPYSFHVPLLIFAPRALHAPVYVDAVTSHIDIAPTVLDLVGIDASEAPLAQGTLVTAPELEHRTTFMFASTYHGADGFVSDGSYFMRRTVDEQHFASDRFDFPPQTLLLPGSERAHAIDDTLDTMYGIQHKLGQVAFVTPRD